MSMCRLPGIFDSISVLSTGVGKGELKVVKKRNTRDRKEEEGPEGKEDKCHRECGGF